LTHHQPVESSDSSVELVQALNAAAARLQRAALSRQEVFDAFVEEVRGLGLRGGIHLLDEDGETLTVAAVAMDSPLLASVEKVARLRVGEHRFRAEQVRVYADVLASGMPVHLVDTGDVVAALLPEKTRRFSKRLLELLGRTPGIYAPIIMEGRAMGVLNIVGRGLGERDVPVIQAFANQVAVALRNADLIVELRGLQAFAQDTLDALEDHLAVVAEDGTILAVNRAWKEFGARHGARDEGTGIGANYLAVCESATGADAEIAREMAQGIRRVLTGRIPAFELTYPFHAGEQQKWFSTRVTLFSGEPRRAVVAHSDITGRVLGETARLESENLFRAMVDSIQAAVFIYDAATDDLLYANARSLELTGYSFSELQRIHYSDLVHQDERDEIVERTERRRRGERLPARLEARLKHKAGGFRWIEYTTVEIDYRGRRSFLGTAYDVTERKLAESGLRQSRERFEALIESISAAAFMFRGTDMIFANRQAQVITGYSNEELLMMKFWDLVHPEMRELVKERGIARQQGQAVPTRYEVKLLTKSGEERWVEFNGTRLELDGEPAVLGTAFDITQRKQAEAALQESEERFRTLVDNAADAIVLLDTETGKFTDTNPQTEQLFGLSRAELLEVGPVEVSPECQPDGTPSADAAAAYIARALGGETLVFEWMHSRADGSEVLCEVRLVRLPGERPVLRGSIIDISGRVAAEQQLRVQAKALEAAGEAMMITDPDGNITWVNPAFTRLTGYLPEEAIGKTPRILSSGQNPRALYENLWQTIKAGAIWQGELTNRRKDGSLYIEEMTITPVFGGRSRISQFIAIKRDVTSQRQRERRLEAVAQVSQALRMAESQAEIGAVTLEQVAALLEIQAVSLTLLDRQQGDYVLQFANGLWEKYIGLRLKEGESVTGALVQDPETYINNDLHSNPDERFTRPQMWKGMTAAAALPLEAHGIVMGVLWVGRSRPWTEEDRHILEAIGNITAAALHRAELHDTTEALFAETRHTAIQLAQQVGALERAKEEIDRSNLELSRLYHASEALLTGETPDLKTLAERIVTSVLEEFGQSNCSVILVQPGRRDLERAAVGGEYADEVRKGKLLLDGKGLVPRAIQSGEIVNVGNVHAVRDYLPNWKAARAEIVIPLKVGGRVLGVIDIQSAAGDAFNDEDERILGIYAERAALAIENARLFDETRERLSQLQALRDIDIAITSSLDIQLTLKVLLDQVLMQLKADAAAVLLLKHDALRYAAGRGFRTRLIEQTQLRPGEGVAGEALMSRRLAMHVSLGDESPKVARRELFRREGFKAYFGAPLVAKGEALGVLEIYRREPFQPDEDWVNFLEALAEQTAIAVNNAELFDGLQRAKTELEVAYSNTLRGWVQALDLRDKETEGHTQRVTEMSARLAVVMGLPPAELQHVTRGALLHDIGKMAIPDGVLLKPGPLTPDERKLIEKHPEYARQFLAEIDYLRPAIDIPYSHHERWDGSGYPLGLKGEDIPLTARIFAVVDVWDALTSDRPYRKAWSRAQAIKYLKDEADRLFDPAIVQRFLEEILGEKM
jgi:PAS domain S-box-containing protein